MGWSDEGRDVSVITNDIEKNRLHGEHFPRWVVQSLTLNATECQTMH